MKSVDHNISPLCAADKQSFREKGYFHGKEIFNISVLEEVSSFVLHSYLQQHRAFITENLEYPHSICNPFPTEDSQLASAKDLLPPYPHINAPTLIGSPLLETRISRHVVSLFCLESFRKFASQFFPYSTNYYLHLAPAVRVVYPGNALAYVPDHIDQGYNSHITFRCPDMHSNSQSYLGEIPYSFLTFWIPVQGIPSVHGGLRIYPSHYVSDTPLSRHDTELWIPSLSSDQSNSIVPDYNIGDCITFHPNVLHGSAPNSARVINKLQSSNSFRISLDIRIFPDTSVTTKHYMSLSTGEQFEPGTGPCAR